MALNYVYLIPPWLVVEPYTISNLTFAGGTGIGQGYVRYTYGYTCLATEGDKVAYQANGVLAINQAGSKYNMIKESDIILIYRIDSPFIP